MFIKSLTLNGFKAFANKTVITFEDGICGLIGPNGCGKSNVLDAIKWVVGEQKVSELRSDKMEDVIFHGSEGGNVCNMAEVEMLVTNENSILPIEFNEISITRRLYRSGESEYLLNRQPCRLRDIQTLFLETGIGKSASSVIEQGRIDKILSLDSEDRRFIFEEAAGVVKYRERKKEYERKIEKTQENLIRVSDLIKELERQQSQSKKQADLSKKYFEIQEKLKKEEIDRLLYQLLQCRKKSESIEKNRQQLTHQIEDHQKTIVESKSQAEDIRSQIQDKREHINSFEKKKIEIDEKLNSNKSQVAIFDERIQEIKEGLEERQGELVNFGKEKEAIKAKIKALTQEVQDKKDEKEANKKKIASFEKEINSLLTLLKTYNHKQNDLKTRIEAIKKERMELNKKHSVVVEDLIKELDILKQKVQEDKKLHSQNKRMLLDFQKEFKEKLKTAFGLEHEEQIEHSVNQSKNEGIESLRSQLKTIYLNLFSLKKTGEQYETLLKDFLQGDDPFYDLIFSAEGTYSKKEKIDERLETLHNENDSCEEKIEHYTLESKKCQNEINIIKQQLADIEINQAAINQSITLNLRIKDEQVANTNTLEMRYATAKNYLDRQNDLLKESVKKKENHLKVQQQLEKENAKLLRDMSSLSLSVKSQMDKMNKSQERILKNEQTLEAQLSKKEEYGFELRLLEKDIESVYDLAINQFSENLKEWQKLIINKTFDLDRIKKNIAIYREELKGLRGSVNPLAEDEYRSLTERLNEMHKQQKDVVRSIEDLTEVVKKIDANSAEIFYSTFKKIQANFHLLFRRLFNGGSGKIVLADEKNPLHSGVDILIQPPGKKFQNINLLSGGEKSLIAIALMFSVFLVKPAQVCLLDEVDASLDKINISRLSKMLFEFHRVTQFIIITHNEKTASIVDYVHGVTMQGGVSQIYSYKFKTKK